MRISKEVISGALEVFTPHPDNTTEVKQMPLPQTLIDRGVVVYDLESYTVDLTEDIFIFEKRPSLWEKFVGYDRGDVYQCHLYDVFRIHRLMGRIRIHAYSNGADRRNPDCDTLIEFDIERDAEVREYLEVTNLLLLS